MIARALRAKRVAAGALTLASPEVKFSLSNESDSPTDVGAYQLVEANKTVEEFMLLGNVLVANRLLESYPGLTLLRNHPSPPVGKFKELIELAATAGVELDVSSSRALADSLDLATREGDPYFNKLLRILSTRCMAPAKYFCSSDKPREEWLHYGLAAPTYTHFTSPIRRYADVVVHRLLAAAINAEALPKQYTNSDAKTELKNVTTNLNARNKSAQLAGRDSVALYTRLYFRDHAQARIEARVLNVTPEKIDILVPRFGIEGTIWLVPRGDEDVKVANAAVADISHDEALHKVAWTCGDGGRATVKIFDIVSFSLCLFVRARSHAV
ncbi:hypothetical protein M885DRAFT_151466 [Pelagophyceae sp. CCMP2097]|nr:hypothetical protein M885DRAFT_151466 [Pelagophyceae sp. CCMP2097]